MQTLELLEEITKQVRQEPNVFMCYFKRWKKLSLYLVLNKYVSIKYLIYQLITTYFTYYNAQEKIYRKI